MHEVVNFETALSALKQGKRVSRFGWNGKGMYISLQVPDANSKMNHPYLYIECPPGTTQQFGDKKSEVNRVPWTPSQTDLLSSDWIIL